MLHVKGLKTLTVDKADQQNSTKYRSSRSPVIKKNGWSWALRCTSGSLSQSSEDGPLGRYAAPIHSSLFQHSPPVEVHSAMLNLLIGSKFALPKSNCGGRGRGR